MFTTSIEIQNKTGNPEAWANGLPHLWEFEVELDYSLSPGQREILNPVDKCQPGYPAEVEDIQVVGAKIYFGSHNYVLGIDSRWIDILEEMIGNDPAIQDEIMEYEMGLAEDRFDNCGNGGW